MFAIFMFVLEDISLKMKKIMCLTVIVHYDFKNEQHLYLKTQNIVIKPAYISKKVLTSLVTKINAQKFEENVTKRYIWSAGRTKIQL